MMQIHQTGQKYQHAGLDQEEKTPTSYKTLADQILSNKNRMKDT